jgi:glycosyltransferase involved in cell wall biosynthesis
LKNTDIVTIVLSYRAQPEVVGAVKSLLDQDEPTEILVVNSGGGSVRDLLQANGITVPCLDYPERLFVGGARNRGIENTQSRYVAFLAADCRARPGWVRHRLAAHRDGARTVASAVVNSHPQSNIATAAHLALFMRRLPGLPASDAIRYGGSYDRALFEEFGQFDESLRTGEDSEFHQRLPDDWKPHWDGRIQTVHLNETRLVPLLYDQFGRGRRYGREMNRLFGARKYRVAKDVMRSWKHAHRLASLGLTGEELDRAVKSMPILRLMSAVKAMGVLLSSPPAAAQPAAGRPRSSPE